MHVKTKVAHFDIIASSRVLKFDGDGNARSTKEGGNTAHITLVEKALRAKISHDSSANEHASHLKTSVPLEALANDGKNIHIPLSSIV